MTKQARHLLAVVLVATALCADRAAQAAPQVQPQIASIASRLAYRLTRSIRPSVPTVRLARSSAPGGARPTPARFAPRRETHFERCRPQGIPFQFRLPPPLV